MSDDAILERFLDLLEAAPVRLTSVPRAEAWGRHVADALAGLHHLDASDGPVVDVGSGTGVPGLVMALRRPDREVHLVESVQKKAAILAAMAADLGAANVRVHAARAEEVAHGDGRDAFGLAVCRALAPPPVAVELCLPLVRPGGRLVIWAGDHDPAAVARTAALLGGSVAGTEPAPGERRWLLVVAKDDPTPAGFPRRPGMAAKRPLAG